MRVNQTPAFSLDVKTVEPWYGRPMMTAQINNGAPPAATFKDVLNNAALNLNDTMRKPEGLLMDAMTTGNVEIHDVIIASTQAEIALNIAQTLITKSVQAYDKLISIQV